SRRWLTPLARGDFRGPAGPVRDAGVPDHAVRGQHHRLFGHTVAERALARAPPPSAALGARRQQRAAGGGEREHALGHRRPEAQRLHDPRARPVDLRSPRGRLPPRPDPELALPAGRGRARGRPAPLRLHGLRPHRPARAPRPGGLHPAWSGDRPRPRASVLELPHGGGASLRPVLGLPARRLVRLALRRDDLKPRLVPTAPWPRVARRRALAREAERPALALRPRTAPSHDALALRPHPLRPHHLRRASQAPSRAPLEPSRAEPEPSGAGAKRSRSPTLSTLIPSVDTVNHAPWRRESGCWRPRGICSSSRASRGSPCARWRPP